MKFHRKRKTLKKRRNRLTRKKLRGGLSPTEMIRIDSNLLNKSAGKKQLLSYLDPDAPSWMDITEDQLIKKLSYQKNKLTNDEMNKLKNVLYNLGIEVPEDEHETFYTKILDLDIPSHRGLMIGFLMQSKYNVLDPFLPLNRNKLKDVDKINSRLTKYLINVLPKIY